RKGDPAMDEDRIWWGARNDALRAALDGAPLAISLGHLIAAAARMAGAPRCVFYLAGAEVGGLHHLAGLSPAPAGDDGAEALAPGALAWQHALATGAAVILPDLGVDPLWRSRQPGCRAFWALPLHDRAGAPLGLLALYFAAPRAADGAERARLAEIRIGR